MTKQVFDIEDYWVVVVFYDINYSLFNHVIKAMLYAGADTDDIREAYDMLKSGKAKAATYSNTYTHISVLMFNPHDTKYDYINSIVHEAEHVKQAMLSAYSVEDTGEPPAYTIGHIVSQMYHVFGEIVLECHV